MVLFSVSFQHLKSISTSLVCKFHCQLHVGGRTELITSSEYVKILAVLKLGVFLSEYPREHLSSLHAGSNHPPVLVPV